ncbi:MAG: isoleucyl-tRNA synthetase, partial [Mycobacterium sp.]|nr:isoleucyl-tRNA synthetase [Mycobacterium sp.]
LTVNARVAGPRIGKDVQSAIKAVKAGEGVVNPDGTLTAGPATLLPEEYSSKLVAADPELTAALPGGAGLVVLDDTVTPELEAEGWARDIIREFQEARRQGAFDIGDRIRVWLAVPELPTGWSDDFRELIAKEILAVDLDIETNPSIELMQGGALQRVGDAVAGKIGPGYPVKMVKVAQA